MSGILIATWVVRMAGLYLLAGIVFAVPFVIKGVGRIDPAAMEGSRGFRLLIFPGVVALWPLLALRWWSGASGPPEECNAHRAAARLAKRDTEAGA